METGSKYYPLYTYLKQSYQDEIVLSLSAIEALLGASLPRSASTYRAWWSNRGTSVGQSAAWMQAGYHVVAIDLDQAQITFRKPGLVYRVQRDGSIVLWNADLVKALRHHMGLSQAEFARELGVRQPTISEWETGVYEPKRSTSKLLTLVAEQAGFKYE